MLNVPVMAVTGLQISAGAATLPPIKFQNVKEICRMVVLESLFNSLERTPGTGVHWHQDHNLIPVGILEGYDSNLGIFFKSLSGLN